MLLIASLLGEHLLLKQELTAAQARTIQRLDIVYGASAATCSSPDPAHVPGKGPGLFRTHIAFHILFGIFIVAALLSIYPTLIYLRWRSEHGAGRGQQLAPDQFGRSRSSCAWK